MVVCIVGIVEFVFWVIDYGVVAPYRKGRFQERILRVVTIEKVVSGACRDDFGLFWAECDVGKAPKCETLVDCVIGGDFKAKTLI